MRGLEEDLARLEQLLRQLEFEYDQFFSGQVRVEPQQTESKFQNMIKSYGGRAIQNPTLRFKYTNIVARFNSFKKVWSRKVREQEEGRVFGRPAKVQVPTVPSAARGRNFIATDLVGEQARMKAIFTTYKQLRQDCGESVERLRLENFTRILAEKVEKIKEMRKCDKVEIRLRREKNKTRILVRPYREGD